MSETLQEVRLGGACRPPQPFPGRAPRRYLVGALLVFSGALVIAGAATGNGAWHSLKTVPPSIIPALLALSAINYALRTVRWLLFSRTLRLDIPAGINALYYVAGFSMTATPGKLGEALRLWLMHRSHGTRYENTAALLVADRLSDAVAITAVVAITVGWYAHYLWMAATSIAIVAAIAGLALRPTLLLALTDTLFGRLRQKPRLFVRVRRAIRALEKLAAPGVFGLALLLGTLGWSAEAGSFSLLLHTLHVAISPMAAAFVFGFGMMVGAISVLPGGLGSTEATMVGLLVSQGVPFAPALVATGVVRLTTLWFAVALGFCALPLSLGRAKLADA